MADNKTQASDADVAIFLGAVAPDWKRADAQALAALMARISGEPARLWGAAIVGFGRYQYRYDSGRQGEMCRIGFSPRKAALTLYLTIDLRTALLERLGKHSIGKGCLYIKRLADVDIAVLGELIAAALADMAARYPVVPASARSPAAI